MCRKSWKWSFLLVVMLSMVLLGTVFVYAGSYVNVLSPNGGETYTGNAVINIAWKSLEPGDKINVYYSVDSGTFWSELTPTSGVADTGSYVWTVPDIDSAKVRVKVSRTGTMYGSVPFPIAYTGTEIDVSDGDFTIKKKPVPSVIQLDPNLIVQPKVPLVKTPANPTSLAGEALSVSEVKLTWKDNADNESAYQVERKTGTGVWGVVAVPVANSTTYEDSGLIADTLYTYRIRANGALVNSEYSNEVQLKTKAAGEPSTTPTPTIPPVVTPQALELRLYIGSQEYYLNSNPQTMDTAPVIREGRTLLPIRYVAEALGADVKWLGEERKTTVAFQGKTIELWIDKNLARINGQFVVIDPENSNVAPVIVPPGRTMLPIRFVAENLGCKIGWDPKIQEVKITYPQ